MNRINSSNVNLMSQPELLLYIAKLESQIDYKDKVIGRYAKTMNLIDDRFEYMMNDQPKAKEFIEGVLSLHTKDLKTLQNEMQEEYYERFVGKQD